MTPPPVIHVSGIRKAYGSTVAVDEVSFDVRAGEIFGLIGPNGAGKTTTMECVEGLRAPDRGAIILIVGSRGQHFGFLERSLSADGSYRWQQIGPAEGAGTETIAVWSQKRVKFDSDLWLIELDIPSPERFIAETTAQG